MIDDEKLERLTAKMRETFKSEKGMVVAAVALDVTDGSMAVMSPMNINPMALFRMALQPTKEITGQVSVGDKKKAN